MRERLLTSKIQVRLLLLVLVAVVPLSLVGLAGILGMWRTSRAQLDASLRNQAELAGAAFEQWLEAQSEPLAAIADYRDQPPADQAEFRDRLKLMLRSRVHWLAVCTVNASGECAVVEPADAKGPSADSVRALLAETGDNTLAVVTDWSNGPQHGVLLISAPVRSGGAVVAQVDVGAISDLVFREVQLNPPGVLAIFGPQRRILLYRNSKLESYLGADLSGSSLFVALGDRRSAVFESESPIDGVRRVYGMSGAGDAGCVVMVGMPSEDLYQPAQNQFYAYTVLSVVGLVLSMAAAALVARGIAKPIERLTSTARRFGEGERSLRAPVGDGGEVGQLSRAFNTMAAQIEEREVHLEEIDGLKSDFVSSVSHEMRTPLTTIKTLTRLLLRQHSKQEDRRDYLETIAAECDRQIDLVLNLLDLSRIEAGTFNLDPVPVNVSDLIKTCVSLQQHSAASRSHELVSDVSFGLRPVLADKGALRRVICGLVENAIKYTPDGGRIKLAARERRNSVILTVSDNGMGIRREDLPHVFEKFYRGRSAAEDREGNAPRESTEAEGVGLGLYIARNVVEHLGGTISVENVTGGGSTFSVCLPVCTEEGENVESCDAQTTAGG